MNLVRAVREANEVRNSETDERVVAARRLVLRDTVTAVSGFLVLMLVSLLAFRDDFNWLFWVVAAPIVALVAAAISSWGRRSTTQEMDRARSIQLLLAAPLTLVIVTVFVWAVKGDLGEAIRVGVAAGAGVGIATLVVFLKSLRPKNAE